MRGILVCIREYLHMCPHTAMYVCRYGIAVYTHGRTQLQEEGTGEGFTGQTRDTKSEGGGGGGGAVRFRPFIHPCTIYLLNGEGDLALGRGHQPPPPPPSA